MLQLSSALLSHNAHASRQRQLLPSRVVLLGPEGATTRALGARVAERLGLPFHAALEVSSAAQDEEVMWRELGRDAASAGARVIEGWHPNNLALAEQRSPRVAALYRERLAALPRENVVIQPLAAGSSSLTQRSLAIARRLGFFILSPLDLAWDEVEELAELVSRRVRSWEKTRRLYAFDTTPT